VDDFDQIERLTRRVGRAAAVGIPVWIVLLALLPFSGLGPLPCLTIATLGAVVTIVLAERRRTRRIAGAAAGDELRRGERAPMSAATAAALTLGAVVLLVYVVFVIRAA
jgi:cobalamin synthase